MNVANNSQTSIMYQYTLENYQAKHVIIMPKVNAGGDNATLSYDVSYGSQVWSNFTGTQVIKAESYKYQEGTRFRILFKAFITPNRTGVPRFGQGTNGTMVINFSVKIYSAAYDSSTIIPGNLDWAYSSYLQSPTQTSLMRTELLDTNGTYQFSMRTMLGNPVLLYRTGANTPSFDKDNIMTYFRTGSPDMGDGFSNVTSDRILRES